MKLGRVVGRLFGRRTSKVSRRPPADRGKSDADKERELEQLVQAGIAANKFPPR